jgi:hypothetical protein
MVFSRQKVDNGIMNVDYIKKAKQPANIFIETLEKIKFDKYKSMQRYSFSSTGVRKLLKLNPLSLLTCSRHSDQVLYISRAFASYGAIKMQ